MYNPGAFVLTEWELIEGERGLEKRFGVGGGVAGEHGFLDPRNNGRSLRGQATIMKALCSEVHAAAAAA